MPYSFFPVPKASIFSASQKLGFVSLFITPWPSRPGDSVSQLEGERTADHRATAIRIFTSQTYAMLKHQCSIDHCADDNMEVYLLKGNKISSKPSCQEVSQLSTPVTCLHNSSFLFNLTKDNLFFDVSRIQNQSNHHQKPEKYSHPS